MKTTHFKNGRIFTSTDGTLHDSLVIRDDKVLFVGSAEAASSHAPDKVVDLGRKVVLPGLIDAHSHLMLLGGSLTKVDCLGKSIPEIQAAIKAAYESDPGAPMILGCQFQYDAIGELPHKRYLDAVCPDKPCIIDNSSLHSAWLNTAAMQAIGISDETPDPKGGEFVRDANGLTGYWRETAVVDYCWPWVAAQTTVSQRAATLRSVFDAYLATGVTAAVDLATVPEDLAALEAYAAQEGELPLRVACHWLVRPSGSAEHRAAQVQEAAAHRDRLRSTASRSRLSVAGIKIISDGVVDSCTAFLREPYPNGRTPGPIWPSDELQHVVTLADALGLQVACHAIGDAAVDQALDAFEVAVAANGPRDRRHRIEHLELAGPDAIARLARLGVVASMQPVHADPVKVVNWDAQLAHGCRCDRKFAWREFEEAGAEVAFGSDAPTAPYHPLPNLYTATTRLSAINPALPDPEDERTKNLARLCVSLETAVRYYTAGGAYSMRAEDEVGTLEPGKSADFAVLDIDPFDGLDSLRKAQKGVAETWVAGQRVWVKES
ncbi:hypothetical protein CspeluHIS016_0111070 [Cutaneotrichosporon spelunceum]|uniref:PLD phosphodiesterase domain-containing protein n=1 Tax=Cutaneotrichosporon spelunceum TaxID=1672016 RepID=A0AAD3TP90_9TREE|nr:hypothetical protein CspeluHIS016_0111070 [Cutaneotrichosporon spelunceum]